MKTTILTSSKDHPIFPYLKTWKDENTQDNNIELILSKDDANGGDFLFLISCSEIVSKDIRDKYKHSLVIHASDLPKGRGWSPHIWQVLEGKNNITLTLLEANDAVDSGRIWLQKEITLEGHELYDEINDEIIQKTLSLMSSALSPNEITPKDQTEDTASYYPKRTPADSAIDISKSIESQFDLLRVSDPDRYPAFFNHKGHKYQIKIEKEKEKNS